MKWGVPQGSLLGPILNSTVMNENPSSINEELSALNISLARTDINVHLSVW